MGFPTLKRLPLTFSETTKCPATVSRYPTQCLAVKINAFCWTGWQRTWTGGWSAASATSFRFICFSWSYFWGHLPGGDCCHNRSAPFWLFLSRRWLWENTRSAPRPGDGPRATPRAHFLVISLVLADVQLVPLTRLYRSAPRTLPTQSKKKRKRRGRFASASSGSGSTDQGPYRRPVRQSKNKVIFFFFGFSVHLGQFEWVPALRGPFFFFSITRSAFG